MNFDETKAKDIEERLDDLAAEIDSISGNCDILTACIEYDNVASNVLYSTVFAMSKHLHRISEEISSIKIRKAVAK